MGDRHGRGLQLRQPNPTPTPTPNPNQACSWGNPPPRYAPAGTNADAVRAPHMLVADSPALLRWLNTKLETTVWPILAAQFGRQAAEEMWLYDAFLLKFDEDPMRSGLGIHVDDDGLGLSINILLSSPDDFEGGGTWFEDSGETVTPKQAPRVVVVVVVVVIVVVL